MIYKALIAIPDNIALNWEKKTPRNWVSTNNSTFAIWPLNATRLGKKNNNHKSKNRPLGPTNDT